MTRTIPGIFNGIDSIGYAYLTVLSDSAKEQIRELLENLCRELPDAIWPMPIEQLHITLCEIVQPKDYSQDKELLFTLHQGEYLDKPFQLFADTQKFTVTFDVIESVPAGDNNTC